MHITYTVMLLLPVLSMLISYVATLTLLKSPLRYKLIDLPNERSSHKNPTPRGGGLAIVFAFVVTSFISLLLSNSITIAAILSLSLPIAILGFIDDLYSLSPKIRLLVQFITVLLLLILSINTFSLYSTLFISDFFLFAFMLFSGIWLINLYNFMDGIDGIATAEAIFVTIAGAILLFWQHPESLILPMILILLGASIGFFFWNFPKARIFMGDIGSGFIGFLLFSFALYTFLAHEIPLITWMIWLSVFWVDSTYTLLIRVLSKQSPFKAHCTHAYQKLTRIFGSHRNVVIFISIYNIIWLLPLGIGSALYPNLTWAMLIASIMPCIIVCFLCKAGVNQHRENL